MNNSFLKEQFIQGNILLINKDLNWTSFDVVHKIKNLIRNNFDIKKIKVGHAGTLDPLATGLLIVCTGKETKNITKYQDYYKEYIAELKIGETTPSFDLETEIDNSFSIDHIDLNLVEDNLKSFIGKQMQVPPIFSAKWKDGKRAYEYARKGIEITLDSKEIEIESIDIIDFDLPKLVLKIKCSKGTYIRSLARDIGKSLNSGAYLSGLIRSAIGKYKIEDAINIKEFEKELINNITI